MEHSHWINTFRATRRASVQGNDWRLGQDLVLVGLESMLREKGNFAGILDTRLIQADTILISLGTPNDTLFLFLGFTGPMNSNKHVGAPLYLTLRI
jgi:hypothetical protein